MINLTHNCGNKVYYSDKYCTECGEKLSLESKTLQIPDVKPDIFKSILPDFPNPKVFTGYVTETYNYKRSHSGSDIQYSYWFLTLDDGNGQKKQINTKSENTVFDSIKVGDVLTVCQLNELGLLSKILHSQDKRRVTTDELPGITVFYKGDKIQWYIDSYFEPDEFSTSPSFYTFIFSALAIWLAFGVKVESAVMGGVTGLLLGFIIYSITKKSHVEKTRLYKVVDDFSSTLAKTSINSLGFNREDRRKYDSDVICSKCECRNPESYKYCITCGAPPSEISLESGQDEKEVQSVGTQRLKILEEGNLIEVFEFKLKRFLMPDVKVNGRRVVQLCRVVDRDIKANVKKWRTEHITEKEYRYASGGYSHTERTVNHTNHRRSEVSGVLLLEDSTGEIREIEFPSSLLRVTDVGDYILYGWTDLYSKKQRLHGSMEFSINLNKDLHSLGERLTDVKLSNDYMMKYYIAFGLLTFVLNFYFKISEYLFVGIIFFFIPVFLLTMALVKKFSNKKALKKHSQPIWDLRDKIMNKRESLIKKLLSLG